MLDRAVTHESTPLDTVCGMGVPPLDLSRPRGPVPAALADPAPVDCALGFAFSRHGSVVLLIRKNRPEWQAGKFNGIGGKVEPGESPVEAMVREFREETGLVTAIGHWRLFLTYTPGEHGTRIHCFSTASVPLDQARSVTDEEVFQINLNDTRLSATLVPSLSWIIPMARFSQFDVPLTADVKSWG